jgi:Catalase
MDAPIGVSRFFRTMATVGPSLSLAFTFAGRFLSEKVRALKQKLGFVQVDPILDNRTAMGVRMFDIEKTLAECLAELPRNDPREGRDSEEGPAFLAIAKLIADGIVAAHYQAAAVYPDPAKLPAAVAMRSQHAKGHGCVHAKFIVNDTLPPEVAAGAFVPGKSYDAVLRFSNSRDTAEPDKEGDGRGVAIKLDLPQGRDKQDFILVNNPVFFVDNVAEYGRFMAILHDRRYSGFVKTLKIILFFVPRRFRMGLIFLGVFRSKIADPFDATYHSMSPYALGDKLVVRYIVGPAKGTGGDATERAVSEEESNYLRDRMRQRLLDGKSPVVLDFSLQIRDRATVQDVERASRAWRRRADRIVPIARIEVPPQNFTTADKFCNCEDMRFNPWHALPEHRPLGGLNRSRLLAYRVSSQVRRRLNMVS